MELKKAIELRTSVRSFLPDPVPVNDIKEMIRLGGLAPSVNNYQPWAFILIQDKETLVELSACVVKSLSGFSLNSSKASVNIKNQVEWYSTFFKDAPALLAVTLMPYETIWEGSIKLTTSEINELRNYPDLQSTGACIENILLSAVDRGYGACWLSGPMVAKEELEKILGIESPVKLISFIAIGKPAKDFKPKEKEDLGKNLRII